PRGAPPAALTSLSGPAGRQLADVVRRGGLAIVGFFGSGANRRLALALGPPEVPAGYLVYAEVPLPPGTSISGGVPGVGYVMYAGPTDRYPVLFATSASTPLRGPHVSQLVDLDNPDGSGSQAGPVRPLLFLVSFGGPAVGRLASLLPWIVGAALLIAALLMAGVVDATRRRRNLALAQVSELQVKNAELDQAVSDQLAAESARARLEGELRQAQRLEAVGQLAGGIAHDFNNLLGVILTYSDFIAEEAGEGPMADDVAEIRTAARRATELTRQLLIFSRRELVRPVPLQINDTVAGLCRMLSRTLEERIELRTVLAEGLPAVVADPGEIEQVVLNLVVNARDAIPASGIITVATLRKNVSDDDAGAQVGLPAGEYVQLSVADTGTGMAAEVAQRVFEPFFTTKGPGSGTGLGLSTVYGIVTRLGGRVGVYSEPGLGATFRVYLPASAESPVAAPAIPEPVPDRATGLEGTVLLVEDEDGVRAAARRILQGGGYRVLEAASAVDALERHGDAEFDLLLTDVIMPGGLTGRDLAERLRERRPDLPVLYTSGYSAEVIATQGILDPGVTLVEKPFTGEDLLAKVRGLLG
ncbi:MAG: ATP-binding protein, partial [Mycobacteriales bacterium]